MLIFVSASTSAKEVRQPLHPSHHAVRDFHIPQRDLIKSVKSGQSFYSSVWSHNDYGDYSVEYFAHPRATVIDADLIHDQIRSVEPLCFKHLEPFGLMNLDELGLDPADYDDELELNPTEDEIEIVIEGRCEGMSEAGVKVGSMLVGTADAAWDQVVQGGPPHEVLMENPHGLKISHTVTTIFPIDSTWCLYLAHETEAKHGFENSGFVMNLNASTTNEIERRQQKRLDGGFDENFNLIEEFECHRRDCDGKCMPTNAFEYFLADGECDEGKYGYNLNCEGYDFDHGDCDAHSRRLWQWSQDYSLFEFNANDNKPMPNGADESPLPLGRGVSCVDCWGYLGGYVKIELELSTDFGMRWGSKRVCILGCIDVPYLAPYYEPKNKRHVVGIGGQSSMHMDLAVNPPFENVNFDLASFEIMSWPRANCNNAGHSGHSRYFNPINALRKGKGWCRKRKGITDVDTLAFVGGFIHLGMSKSIGIGASIKGMQGGGGKDVPAHWQDSQGNTCDDYALHSYASNHGWCADRNYLTGTDGKRASEACCACGGGECFSATFQAHSHADIHLGVRATQEGQWETYNEGTPFSFSTDHSYKSGSEPLSFDLVAKPYFRVDFVLSFGSYGLQDKDKVGGIFDWFFDIEIEGLAAKSYIQIQPELSFRFNENLPGSQGRKLTSGSTGEAPSHQRIDILSPSGGEHFATWDSDGVQTSIPVRFAMHDLDTALVSGNQKVVAHLMNDEVFGNGTNIQIWEWVGDLSTCTKVTPCGFDWDVPLDQRISKCFSSACSGDDETFEHCNKFYIELFWERDFEVDDVSEPFFLVAHSPFEGLIDSPEDYSCHEIASPLKITWDSQHKAFWKFNETTFSKQSIDNVHLNLVALTCASHCDEAHPRFVKRLTKCSGGKSTDCSVANIGSYSVDNLEEILMGMSDGIANDDEVEFMVQIAAAKNGNLQSSNVGTFKLKKDCGPNKRVLVEKRKRLGREPFNKRTLSSHPTIEKSAKEAQTVTNVQAPRTPSKKEILKKFKRTEGARTKLRMMGGEINLMKLDDMIEERERRRDLSQSCGNGKISYTLTMTDSYGDGWNGADFTLKNKGTNVLFMNGETFENGYDSTETVCVPDGSYEAHAGGGEYPHEISWSLAKTSNGVVVAEASETQIIDFSVSNFASTSSSSGTSSNAASSSSISSFGVKYEGATKVVATVGIDSITIGPIKIASFEVMEEMVLWESECETGDIQGTDYSILYGACDKTCGECSDDRRLEEVDQPSSNKIRKLMAKKIQAMKKIEKRRLTDCSGYKAVLIDSFGDGWNGAELSITHDSGTVLEHGLTFGSGSSYEICLGNPSGCYNVYVTEGSYPGEVSWEIQDSSGDAIQSGGTDVEKEACFSGGSSGSDCGYTAVLLDSYGDGWNGAELSIQDLGYSGLTFNTGSSHEICLGTPSTGCYVAFAEGGSYPSEVSFEIRDTSGTVVVSAGADDNANLCVGGATIDEDDDDYTPPTYPSPTPSQPTSSSGDCGFKAYLLDFNPTPSNPTPSPANDCGYKAVLVDSYGDGWNGAELSITDANSGEVTFSGLTFTSGSSHEVCIGAPTACYVAFAEGGSYPSEVSFEIRDASGTVVMSAVPDQNANFCIGGATVEDDDEDDDNTHYYSGSSSGDCGYKLVLLDSYGDGWNGAEMTISDDSGSVLVSGLTIETGNLGEACIGTPEYDECYTFYVTDGSYPAVLVDSYGDGWNGAELSITDANSGEVTFSGFTFTSGSSHEECLGTPPTACYVALAEGGSYPSEVSFEIRDASGTVVVSASADENANFCVGGATIDEDEDDYGPGSSSGDCGHKAVLMDSYGDGWNGAELSFAEYGITVVSGLTLESGVSAEICFGGASSTSSGNEGQGDDDEDAFEITFELHDSYGDGWNGAYLIVLNANTNAAAYSGQTVETGSFNSETLSFTSGCYTVKTFPGDYPSENSWVATFNGDMLAAASSTDEAVMCVNDYSTLTLAPTMTPATSSPTSTSCSRTDCSGECVSVTLLSWFADGYCDDGSWGLDLNCAEANFDDGDCAASSSSSGCSTYDCDNNCADGFFSLKGDGTCDWGAFGANFDCEGHNYDDGDCVVATDDDDYNYSGSQDCTQYDCIGQCADDSISAGWVGDGSCDDGTYGSHLNCATFENDGELTSFINSGCVNSDYIGDGYCDNDNYHNNAVQNYDGGDCCAETCVSSHFDCGGAGYHCIDPAYSSAPDCHVEHPGYIGDGYCDHDGPYNTKSCNYDGGDCCVSSCSGGMCGTLGYDCKDENHVNDASGANDDFNSGASSFLDCDGNNAQGYQGWLGDGDCDDGTHGANFNCEAHGFDGGDCNTVCEDDWEVCGLFAEDCESLFTPGKIFEHNCDKTCGICGSASVKLINFCDVSDTYSLGDGFCDKTGKHNTLECGFDGGDCCEKSCTPGDYLCGSNGYECHDPKILNYNEDEEGGFHSAGGFHNVGGKSVAPPGSGDTVTPICNAYTITGFLSQNWLNRPYVMNENEDETWSWSNHDAEFFYDIYNGAELKKDRDQWKIISYDKDSSYTTWASTAASASSSPPASTVWSVLLKTGKFKDETVNIECGGEIELITSDYPDCHVDNPSWVGDGHCDHCEYNTEECGWDGGDCCSETCTDTPSYLCAGNKNHCLDPSTNEYKQEMLIILECDEFFIGNGYCDQQNNNEVCNYDGGDCCEISCVNSTNFICGKTSSFECVDPDPEPPLPPLEEDGDDVNTGSSASTRVSYSTIGLIVEVSVCTLLLLSFF
ncbi:hypothetical protein TL16_g10024 [Triparma laevis f. inornata]|uniref:LNR domain-containing protein n=1 Tax=Triparma laevis f. inornata TaxID=1714386 RepID=A0A9W7BB82_9STRA|nr:hypothetical protein TL16_g10024 [Triparma laevis f. inornata]